MANATTVPALHNHTTGLSDSTYSSVSSTASKYSLDESDERPVLLYHYRGGEGLAISSERKICEWLDKNDRLRVTKKRIPPWTSYLEVEGNDFLLDNEKRLHANSYNYHSSLASVKVPSMVYWSRLLFGNYKDLYIVSRQSSADSSTVDEDSRRTSPSSTWPHDLDERLEALANTRHDSK